MADASENCHHLPRVLFTMGACTRMGRTDGRFGRAAEVSVAQRRFVLPEAKAGQGELRSGVMKGGLDWRISGCVIWHLLLRDGFVMAVAGTTPLAPPF